MTNYSPNDDFPIVRTYDTDTPVLGGASGESNDPIKRLADRTEWVKNRAGAFIDVVELTGNTTIDATYANKLIVVRATSNVTLTIANVNTFRPGHKITIIAKLSGAGGPFWVNVVTGQNIEKGSLIRTNIWMYDTEKIELTAEASIWDWTDEKGNFDKVGEDAFVRTQPVNSLIANGTLGDLRSKYPRLWEVVEAEAVTDDAWTSNQLRYSGFHSTGNGTTTFRRRDLRSMFMRSLDLSRGISLARMDNIVGGYEADAVGQHKHPVKRVRTDSVGANYEGNSMRSGGDRGLYTGDTVDGINNTDATENKVKSVGYIPVTFY